MSAASNATVFAVIPVFNRLDRTKTCIECLQAQTFQPVKIIVADGGSTDGTPEVLKQSYPDVVVLTPEEEMWWAGSTRIGIEWALENGATDDDFVMLVNNDTEFEPGYVERLVSSSRRHNVAIGGIVVDESDSTKIIDAGVDITWDNYAIKGRHSAPPEPFDPVQKTDVLPGRGTIIPVHAIKKAGNVDDTAFPHYLADYDFTYRIGRDGGVGLAVDFEAVIKTEPMVAPPPPTKHPLRQSVDIWNSHTSRRSKSNIYNQLAFVERHAPEEYRDEVISRVKRGRIYSSLSPARSWFWAHPVVRFLLIPYFAARKLFHIARKIFVTPYFVAEADIDDLRLDREKLLSLGVLEQSEHPGYLTPLMGRKAVTEVYGEALPLISRSGNVVNKIQRYVDIHGFALPEIFGGQIYENEVDLDQIVEARLPLNKLMDAGLIEPSPTKDRIYIVNRGSQKSDPIKWLQRQTRSRKLGES